MLKWGNVGECEALLTSLTCRGELADVVITLLTRNIRDRRRKKKQLKKKSIRACI